MKRIEEININGERVFLRKGFLGWSVVHPSNWLLKKEGLPLLNKETSRKNFISGGSWIKLGIVLGLCFLLVMAIFEFVDLGNLLNECNDKLNVWKGIKYLP